MFDISPLPAMIASAALPTRSAPSPAAELVTDQLEKPSLDTRTYRVIRLANELEVLLVHDEDTDKASAALDVEVGHYSDEPEMPGMAHAVEHLLFMGTKTFPVENDYSQYLTANSGYANAYTDTTSTNYFFELTALPAKADEPLSADNATPLYGALNRFSKFFSEPLFAASSLDRELRAVDSEHKKNLQDDMWRLNQLEAALANPKHPFSKFGTGNIDVLKVQPEQRGINVRDKFVAFHATHYSANRMKLVILGREPLDLLQEWAVALFSPVPNKNLSQNRWLDEPPYRPDQMRQQIFAKPIMNMRELQLHFVVPNQSDLFESAPCLYLSHLIGHEGPGSIMAYAKTKNWITGLSSGTANAGPGSPAIFQCNMQLTETGLENWRQVAAVFFRYVAVLRRAGPQRWVFDESRALDEVDFKFQEKMPASSFTSVKSHVMQRPVPREALLRSNWMRKFEPDLISECLDCLTPDNLRITVVSQKAAPGTGGGGDDNTATWDQKEQYYGVEYRTEPIPADFLEELRRAGDDHDGGDEKNKKNSNNDDDAAESSADLHLPRKNAFIPTRLDVEKRDDVKTPMRAPRLIRNDCRARTWWKKDDTFWVPRANVFVRLVSPIWKATAAHQIKALVFTELVRDALEEYAYDASLAGLDYGVRTDEDLILKVDGYNDKLPVLLEKVLVTMRDLEFKQDRFDTAKERIKRMYTNFQMIAPYMLAMDRSTWLNSNQHWSTEDCTAEIDAVTVEAARLFRDEALSRFSVEVYAHGNLYRDEALTLTDTVVSTLRPRILPREQTPAWRSLIVPPGSNYVYEKMLSDPANVNHAVDYVIYTGPCEDGVLHARTLLLSQLIQEATFDQLRTKEQLGYIVSQGSRYYDTRTGIMILVQSEQTPRYIEDRIEAFLDQQTAVLTDMADDVFENHKRSVIARRLEKPKRLNQESNRHWGQITGDTYNFDLAIEDAEIIKTTTKADMLDMWNRHVNPSSETRAKLSVWQIALGALSVDAKVKELVKELGFADDDADGRKLAGMLTESQTRRDPVGLGQFLVHEMHLDREQVAKVLAVAKQLPEVGKAEKKEVLVDGTAAPAVVEAKAEAKTGTDDSAGTGAGTEGNTIATKQEENLRSAPALAVKPVFLTNVAAFKAGLVSSEAARPCKDFSEFEDLDAKL